jgi:hypothetical protein
MCQSVSATAHQKDEATALETGRISLSRGKKIDAVRIDERKKKKKTFAL